MSYHTFNIGPVTLAVDQIRNQLLSVKNNSQAREDLHIPHILDGFEIKLISDYAFAGIFGRISFDKEIEVGGAFRASNIDTVIWPAERVVIPNHCFADSRIKHIEGIENVTSIGNYAFYGSCIEAFKWPANVKYIPEGCFASSNLRYISGIENVTEIGESAFKQTDIKSFSWPEKAVTIPKYCFYKSDLESIKGIENVTCICEYAFNSSKIKSIVWPEGAENVPMYCFCRSALEHIYGCENIHTIGVKAFASTKLQGMDLSSSMIWDIGEFAFLGLDKASIIKPYYINDETFEFAFHRPYVSD